MTAVTALLVDVGDVLVATVPDAQYRALAGCTGLGVEEVRRRVELDGLCLQYELGQCDTDTFLREVSNRLPGELSRATVKAAWNSVIGEPTAVAEALRHLPPTISVALASNTNELHAELVLDKLSSANFFSRTMFSHEMGVAKPDHAFFAMCLDELPQGEAAFVDDKQLNVDAAVVAGMRGVLHRNAARTVATISRITNK